MATKQHSQAQIRRATHRQQILTVSSIKTRNQLLELNGLKSPPVAWLGQLARVVDDVPYLAISMARSSMTLSKCVGILKAYEVAVEGWGLKTIEYVLKKEAKAEVRAATFTLAVNMGALWLASKFFHTSEGMDHFIGDKELADWIDGQRYPVARILGKDGLINYANVIADVGQHCAPWLENWRQRQIQGGLRKLIKHSKNLNALFWGAPRDFLFVNHVRLGLGYYAKRQPGYKAIRKIQTESNASSAIEQIDTSVNTILAGGQHIVRQSDFKNSTIDCSAASVMPDSVMISLHTHNGDTLAITAYSEINSVHSVYKPATELKEDWHKLLQVFACESAKDIERCARLEISPKLKIPAHLRELIKKIIRVTLHCNPNARRIFLHADPMWNVVPWQFIMLHDEGLVDWIQEKIQFHVKSGARQEVEYSCLIVWRAPGLRLGKSGLQTNLKQREVMIDKSEPTFQRIESMIRSVSVPNTKGFLSLLAHGHHVAHGIRNFYLNGLIIDIEALYQFDGYPLIVLHICDGASVQNITTEDDTLGLPGALLLQGSKVVVAAGLPVPVSTGEGIKEIETRFGAITDVMDMPAIEKLYALACKHPEAALYTLYSDAVAPILFLPADERDARP